MFDYFLQYTNYASNQQVPNLTRNFFAIQENELQRRSMNRTLHAGILRDSPTVNPTSTATVYTRTLLERKCNIKFHIDNVSQSTSALTARYKESEAYISDTVFSLIKEDLPDENVVDIVYFRPLAPVSERRALYDRFVTELERRGYSELKQVSLLCQKSRAHSIRVMHNPKVRQFIVITSDYFPGIPEILHGIIPKLENFADLNEDYQNLLIQLGEQDNQAWTEALNKILSQEKITQDLIQERLLRVQQDYKAQRIERLERKIEDNKHAVETQKARIRDHRRNITRHLEEKFYLENNHYENSAVTDLFEMLTTNQSVTGMDFYDEQLLITINVPLTYWDTDAFITILNNKGSYLWADIEEEAPEIAFLREVFINERFKLKMGAEISLNLASNDYVLNQELSADHLNAFPNPHINNFGCLGGHENMIDEAMAEGNYDTAILQFISAVQNLNFHDSVVIRKFVEQVFSSDSSTPFVIDAETNTMHTMSEIMSKIRAELKQAQEGGTSTE